MTTPAPTRARFAVPGNPHRGLGQGALDVLDSLRTLGRASATRLAEHTGRSRWLVGAQLWRLHARGLVEHDDAKPPKARRMWWLR